MAAQKPPILLEKQVLRAVEELPACKAGAASGWRNGHLAAVVCSPEGRRALTRWCNSWASNGIALHVAAPWRR
eukprot:1109163-Lingulodinium_polyedra.AAC.1